MIDNKLSNKCVLYSLIFLTFLGCQEITPVKKPENLIPREQMEEIMYEAIILKSARGFNVGQLASKGVNPDTYIFEKFGIDSTQYAANTAYYASQLEEYTQMNTRVKERIVALFNVDDSIVKMEKKKIDSARTVRSREINEERKSKNKKDSLGLNQEIQK